MIRTVVIGDDGVPRPVGDTPADDHKGRCPWAAAARVFVAHDVPACPVPTLIERTADVSCLYRVVAPEVALGVPQARAPPRAA